MSMYATLQTRLEGLRERARSNQYTQAAVERLEACTDRLKSLSADTAAQLAERRQALMASLQGKQDASVAALRERRDAAVERLEAVKQRAASEVSTRVEGAKAAVAAQQERVVAVVRSTQATVQERLAARKAGAQASLDAAATYVFAAAAFVMASLLAAWTRAAAEARARAPAVHSKAAGAVESGRPYVERAVRKAAEVDRLSCPACSRGRWSACAARWRRSARRSRRRRWRRRSRRPPRRSRPRSRARRDLAMCPMPLLRLTSASHRCPYICVDRLRGTHGPARISKHTHLESTCDAAHLHSAPHLPGSCER